MDNTQTMNVKHDIVIKKYAKPMPDEKVNFSEKMIMGMILHVFQNKLKEIRNIYPYAIRIQIL